VVDPHRLRFDFNHHKALTPGEIEQIENLVNNKIRENQPVCWYEISYEEAVQRPEIKQFFGEKYGSQVRVIDIDYSKELCGGTHTTATGPIGYFRIVKESSIAAGIRRIEAVTGAEAEAYSRESELQLEQCAALLKTQPTKLLERIEKLLEENKQHQQDLKQAKKGQQENLIKELMGKIETNGPFPLLLAEIPLPAEELKICVEEIMARNPTLALVAGSGLQDKCSLLVRVSDDLVKRGINAVEIVKAIAPLIEGSGGGKPQSAQAGGKAPQHLGKALDKAREYLSKR
jgi:alanyl-tRNA synthetase